MVPSHSCFFPNFTLSTFSVCWKLFWYAICNIISSCDQIRGPKLVSLQLPGRRTRCRIDHDPGRAAQSVSEPATWAVWESETLPRYACSSRFRFLRPLPTFKFVSNLDVTKGNNKILCSKFVSVSLAQPSLPAKTHQIPADAKATTAFIIFI